MDFESFDSVDAIEKTILIYQIYIKQLKLQTFLLKQERRRRLVKVKKNTKKTTDS